MKEAEKHGGSGGGGGGGGGEGGDLSSREWPTCVLP
jgi:hypothetical protein